ncbi:unnamed protein product [Rangifer tarandus platyrhynchus]|uniref:Uncharacterized protein n=1 Tax=Rangifer tarandus platyrhynchus TaxID=3082113 RepID=A0ABN8ZI90_RANTA|nr:unnamed protein product [Rangifer tarandus platyrhynchus]
MQHQQHQSALSCEQPGTTVEAPPDPNGKACLSTGVLLWGHGSSRPWPPVWEVLAEGGPASLPVERLQQGQRLCPAHGHGLAQTSLAGTALTPGPREASGLPPPSLFCRHLQEPPWPNPILFMRRQRKQLLLFRLSLSTPGPHQGVKAKGPLLCVLCESTDPPTRARSTDPRLPGALVTEAQPAPASLVLQQN